MNTAYSITSKGQVTLPKKLRDAVGLTTSHRVTFHRRGQDIIIRKTPTLEEVSAEFEAEFKARNMSPATQADYDNARNKFYEQGGTW